MTDDKDPLIDRIWKWLDWLSLGILLINIPVFIWIGTLPPLARRGDIRRLIFNLVGFPLILIGIGGIVYGGYIFLKRTLNLGNFESTKKTSM